MRNLGRHMDIKFFAVFLSLILVNSTSFADSKKYQLELSESRQSGINFQIGYTLGTHEGESYLGSGSLTLSQDPFQLLVANFILPITHLDTRNSKRDCHLIESLGLDYKVSDYPRSHICDSRNLLPSSGPNSVAFPEIRFQLLAFQETGGLSSLVPGIEKNIEVQGTFSMHGVENNISVPVTLLLKKLSDGQETLTIQGDFKVLLSDYGATVKPVMFVTVEDEAKVHLNMTMKLVQN